MLKFRLVKKLIYNTTCFRFLCSTPHAVNNASKYVTLNTSNASCEQLIREAERVVNEDLLLYDNFVTEEEQDELMKEVDRSFRRSKYEYDHWDGAIRGFRETEKSRWSPSNEIVLNRIRSIGFVNEASNPLTHILDLAKDGFISPHVDSVKFCGSKIVGLNLLSSAVMRFVHSEDKNIVIDLMLPMLSLYVMKDTVRYDYTHEVFSGEFSFWNDNHVPRDRRISILMRNDPTGFVSNNRNDADGNIMEL